MPSVVQTPLPIDAHVAEIAAHVRAHRSAVIVAPPGSGKTTRIPPALAAIGRTILLQPRRVAARALARRIALERGWTIGNEIGWQIRFERKFSDRTRLLVATEGILTARLQSDPLLSDFDVVILDEFHERSIHADVALALAKQAMDSRDDLAVVVMSATIAAADVARFLGGARIFDVGARRFAIDLQYKPGVSMSAAIREQLRDAEGDMLCFLPGMREIERTRAELSNVEALVLPLHGSLDVDAQERALAPANRRKVILATNIAETSLTVDGVTDVIDSGVHKVLRFDPETAVDHLVVERIAADSAEQRAGRAGRTRAGRAVRLWDSRDMLRPHREPDVRRVDLAPPLLDIIAWGGDPRTFAWFERPPEDRIDAGLAQLDALHARDAQEQLRALPLHPRLARIVIDAHGADDAIAIAVQLSGGAPAEIHELSSIARRVLGGSYRKQVDDATLRRALLAGYPDRVAQRREPKSPRLLLSSGTGATLAREIDDGNGEFLVILDVTGDLVRNARVVEREWLSPTHREVVHEWDGNRVRAIERSWYGAILLHEQNVAPEATEAERILAEHVTPDPLLARRVGFAEIDVDWRSIIARAGDLGLGTQPLAPSKRTLRDHSRKRRAHRNTRHACAEAAVRLSHAARRRRSRSGHFRGSDESAVARAFAIVGHLRAGVCDAHKRHLGRRRSRRSAAVPRVGQSTRRRHRGHASDGCGLHGRRSQSVLADQPPLLERVVSRRSQTAGVSRRATRRTA
jgi:ATP-dependent helicase HrpB